MTTHIMLDLETMGINNLAPVLAIGAVRFDPVAGTLGEVFYQTVDFEDACANGTVDPSTIKWWLKQSDAARSALLKDGVPLIAALHKFSVFYTGGDLGGDEKPLLWCNGPSFDAVLLANAYGTQHMQVPWAYNAPRDFRTMRTLSIDILDKDVPNTSDVASHRADEDAIWQAKVVMNVWADLQRVNLA